MSRRRDGVAVLSSCGRNGEDANSSAVPPIGGQSALDILELEGDGARRPEIHALDDIRKSWRLVAENGAGPCARSEKLCAAVSGSGGLAAPRVEVDIARPAAQESLGPASAEEAKVRGSSRLRGYLMGPVLNGLAHEGQGWLSPFNPVRMDLAVDFNMKMRSNDAISQCAKGRQATKAKPPLSAYSTVSDFAAASHEDDHAGGRASIVAVADAGSKLQMGGPTAALNSTSAAENCRPGHLACLGAFTRNITVNAAKIKASAVAS
ncbi:MAG: hypothetical protein EPN30_04000 [Actinomycetota bacterium]|nr:MAG: hypothetical protein EPN30_04000 [Actinomycetota bacterium]